MSQENVDALRRIGDAINRGDLEAAMTETRADVVFEPQRAATEGAYLGREGLRRSLAD